MKRNYSCILAHTIASFLASFSSLSHTPSITASVFAFLVFYLLYLCNNTTLTAVCLLSFTLSTFSLIIFLTIEQIMKSKVPENNAEKGRVINDFLHKRIPCFLFFLFVGAFIASLAYTKFLLVLLPPKTLASTQKITKVKVALLQDAYPLGSAYYQAKASLLQCKYADGSAYSCKGDVVLAIPSVFIKQNYFGSYATLKRQGAEIEIFSSGLILEVDGHFAKMRRKDVYSMPRFIVSQNSNFEFGGYSSFLYSCRAHLKFRLNKLLFGWKEAGSLLQALLTANRDFLNIEDVNAFRKAGTSHVLALSGMHLAIIGGIASFFSSLLVGRKLVKLSILSICFLFLFFAGASPSLLRSFLMLCIVATSRLLYVKVELLAVLALTFLIHLFSFPQDALTLSFALSYSALFGILVFGNSFSYFLSPFLPDFLCSSMSASLGATFATTPLIAIMLGQISIIGVIATCIISPLISIFLVLGISLIALSLLAPITYHLSGMLLNLFYDSIRFIVHIFALFPVIKCETATSCMLSFLPFILALILVVVEKKLQNLRERFLIIS